MFNRLTLITLLFLFSCQSKKDANELELFSGATMRLSTFEKVIAISPEIKTRYFSHFANRNIQLPLFKFVQNTNYDIYIGLPLNATISNMLHSPLAVNDSNLVTFKSDTANYVYRSYFLNNVYLTEYVKLINKNILYMLCETTSKKTQDSLFNLDLVSTRFNNNH